MKFEKFIKFWFPAILYSVIIFYVSSLPDVKTPVNLRHMDKLAHFVEYFPLGFLMTRAFLSSWGIEKWSKVFFSALFFSVLVGMLDEYRQGFVAGRDSSYFDVGADALGACLGGYLFLVLTKKLMPRN